MQKHKKHSAVVEKKQKRFHTRFLSEEAKQQLIIAFKQSKQRLIFLDYDGTLTPYAKHPLMAKPAEKLLMLLKRLSGNLNNDVIIVSGRGKAILQEWLGLPDIALAAEHGAWLKEKHCGWKLSGSFASNWKPKIRLILQQYTDCLPGSFIEEKDFSIVWHYRTANEKLCLTTKADLLHTIAADVKAMGIEILQGNTVIEVRAGGANKGIAGIYWTEKKQPDFILAIGDDLTDEDLFFVLPETAYSIKVGTSPSFARYHLPDNQQPAVIELLEELAKN